MLWDADKINELQEDHEILLALRDELFDKIATLHTLFREAMREWGSCTRGTDAYSINRFENFSNRPDVKKVMEG